MLDASPLFSLRYRGDAMTSLEVSSGSDRLTRLYGMTEIFLKGP